MRMRRNKMDYVEPNAGVKPESPDAALYVQSLLAEANHSQLFTDAELEEVQMALLNLLAAKIASHTSDGSSSVRIEVAETLMKSNLYTIGLYLKSLPGPAEALKALQETVSYTHLRAHETRHDLVCRLLLEKKKK